VYKVLVGKPKGNRPLGRPRRRWEDGIRMDLREIGLGSLDWIRLAQDRDRWRAVVSDEPSGSCATELVCKFLHFSPSMVLLLGDYNRFYSVNAVCVHGCIVWKPSEP
jgi:hypothetical protein